MRPPKKLRALLLSSTIAVAALLVSVGAAVAQRCESPPGTSGIEQYCETVPTAKGDRESGTGRRVGRSLDRGASRSLEQAGRDGRGVLALPASGKGGRAEKAGRGKQSASKEPSGNAIGAVGSGIESGSSSGPGFIWLLLAAGVGMAGIAWIRYRRDSDT